MEGEKFSASCNEILKQAEDFYHESAHHYDSGVFEKVGKELKNSLLEALYKCFDIQLSALEQKTQQNVKKDVKVLEQKALDTVAPHINKLLKVITEKYSA